MREQLQRVAVLPIGIGQREEIAALGRAGIVDEDVETSELAPRRRDQRRGRARRPQIERADRGLAALAADRLRHVRERRLVAPREQEVAALRGQGQSDAAADAAARSGHQRDLSLQPQLHSQPPCSRAGLSAAILATIET